MILTVTQFSNHRVSRLYRKYVIRMESAEERTMLLSKLIDAMPTMDGEKFEHYNCYRMLAGPGSFMNATRFSPICWYP